MSPSNGSWWSVIPRTAKIIALVVYAGFAPLMRFVLLPTDPEMRQWLEWQKLLFSAGLPALLVVYILIVGFVYGDAKRRGMRYAMWTLIAALMPYLIGVIVYLVVRDPLLSACPSCQTRAQRGFAFCPKCGTALARPAFCGKCGRAAEPEWSHCAYCGANLSHPSTQSPSTP